MTLEWDKMVGCRAKLIRGGGLDALVCRECDDEKARMVEEGRRLQAENSRLRAALEECAERFRSDCCRNDGPLAVRIHAALAEVKP